MHHCNVPLSLSSHCTCIIGSTAKAATVRNSEVINSSRDILNILGLRYRYSFTDCIRMRYISTRVRTLGSTPLLSTVCLPGEKERKSGKKTQNKWGNPFIACCVGFTFFSSTHNVFTSAPNHPHLFTRPPRVWQSLRAPTSSPAHKPRPTYTNQSI